MADLESFLDRLAEVNPQPVPARGSSAPPFPVGRRADLITFAPDGPRGVAAYLDGIKAASS